MSGLQCAGVLRLYNLCTPQSPKTVSLECLRAPQKKGRQHLETNFCPRAAAAAMAPALLVQSAFDAGYMLRELYWDPGII